MQDQSFLYLHFKKKPSECILITEESQTSRPSATNDKHDARDIIPTLEAVRLCLCPCKVQTLVTKTVIPCNLHLYKGQRYKANLDYIFSFTFIILYSLSGSLLLPHPSLYPPSLL